jgi:hypothetical protein
MGPVTCQAAAKAADALTPSSAVRDVYLSGRDQGGWMPRSWRIRCWVGGEWVELDAAVGVGEVEALEG